MLYLILFITINQYEFIKQGKTTKEIGIQLEWNKIYPKTPIENCILHSKIDKYINPSEFSKFISYFKKSLFDYKVEVIYSFSYNKDVYFVINPDCKEYKKHQILINRDLNFKKFNSVYYTKKSKAREAIKFIDKLN